MYWSLIYSHHSQKYDRNHKAHLRVCNHPVCARLRGDLATTHAPSESSVRQTWHVSEPASTSALDSEFNNTRDPLPSWNAAGPSSLVAVDFHSSTASSSNVGHDHPIAVDTGFRTFYENYAVDVVGQIAASSDFPFALTPVIQHCPLCSVPPIGYTFPCTRGSTIICPSCSETLPVTDDVLIRNHLRFCLPALLQINAPLLNNGFTVEVDVAVVVHAD
jgi:hypothetical protein